MAHTYSVFGGRLSSPVDFPELQPIEGEATWRLAVASAPFQGLDGGKLIGEDAVYGDVKVRCHVVGAAHHLVYDDTGRFEVRDGREVTWFPPDALTPQLLDAMRADLIGRVLALAMHQRGMLSLHASAIAIEGRGYSLMAPKMYGKSTLATALVRAGGRLLSDDTAPVSFGDAVLLHPGVHQLRLWRDSAAQLDAGTPEGDGRKVIVGHFREGEVEHGPVPYGGAYLLSPAAPNAPQAATRERLSEIQATMALIEHAKLGPLLGGADAARLFELAASVARRVPVWILSVARDLGRVDEAAQQVMAWAREGE